MQFAFAAWVACAACGRVARAQDATRSADAGAAGSASAVNPAAGESPAFARDDSPANKTAGDAPDRGIVRRRGDRRESRTADGRSGGASSPGVPRGLGWTAPAAVIALLLLALLALRSRTGRASGPRHPAMEVLGRLPLNGRQNLLLVRLGRSVILLGSAGDGLRTLAQVNDPVEVVELIGAAARGRSDSLSSQFTELMKGAGRPFAARPAVESDAAPAPAVPDATGPSEVGRSTDDATAAVRRLRRQLREFASQPTG